MDGVIEIAKLFKERENHGQIFGGVGKVRVNPLIVEFNNLLLDEELIVNTVYDLKDGDRVAVIPSGGLFIIVGRVYDVP